MRSRVTGPFGTSTGSPTNVTIVGPNPLPVTLSGATGLDIKKTYFHDIAAANINATSGSFVALGDGSAIGAAVSKLQMTATEGEPLQFAVGASAGAAVKRWISNQGEGPQNLDIALLSGDKLWVKSLSANAVMAGYITLNLVG